MCFYFFVFCLFSHNDLVKLGWAIKMPGDRSKFLVLTNTTDSMTLRVE